MSHNHTMFDWLAITVGGLAGLTILAGMNCRGRESLCATCAKDTDAAQYGAALGEQAAERGASAPSPSEVNGRQVSSFLPTAPVLAASVPCSPLGGGTTPLRPSPGGFIRMEVTAYSLDEKSCGKWARVPLRDRRTASGTKLDGLLAAGVLFCAAPPEIPFGTILDVPGYGRAVVLDRGGAIRSGRLDVFFADTQGPGSGHRAALAWGRRTLTVEIVKE